MHSETDLHNHIANHKILMSMITTEHRMSELISMYHELADMYSSGANKKASLISDYVTRENLSKSLSTLSIQKIFDAGGGQGQWASFFAEQERDVTLMDISPEMLKVAKETLDKKALQVNIIEGNIEETGFQNEEFDLVFAEGGVISLTPNPEKMMQEFSRIVKPGGYIWIDYLNLHGWAMLQPDIERKLSLIKQDEEMIYMGKNEIPFRLFAPKTIRHLLYDAGFLEINEFGNGIISNPLKEDFEYGQADMQELMKAELAMSRNYIMTGSAFHIQVLAQKIIH